MKLITNNKDYNVEVVYNKIFYVSTEEYTGIGDTIEDALRNLSDQLEYVSDERL